jgi:hypothetical protein
VLRVFGRSRYSTPKKALRKPVRRKPVVDRRMTEVILPVKDLTGNLVFEGTEAEWRQWAIERRQLGEFDRPLSSDS